MRIRLRAAGFLAALAGLGAMVAFVPAAHGAAAPRPVVGGASADTALTFPRFYESLAALSPDTARVAEVASIQIVRDAGTFVFEAGTLALCRPVAGAICAAVFSGRGTFLFTPPPGIERDQLERTHGRRALRRNFQNLVLLFSDSTLSEFSQIARFGPGTIPKAMRETLHDILPFLVNTSTHSVPPHIAKPLLDPVGDGLFLAVIAGSEGLLAFAVDPQLVERVELLRQPDNDRYGVLVRHGLEIVSRFRAACDTLASGDTLAADTAVAEGDTRPPVSERHTTLHAVVAGGDLGLRVTATLELESALANQRWLPFQMPSGALIESASWDGGAAAPRWSWNGNAVMWVRCDPPLAAGERRTLRIVYRARPLQRENDVIYNDAGRDWYPWLDRQSRSTFEISIEMPSRFQAAATGVNVAAVTRGGVTTSHWKVDSPVPFVSFELGSLRRFDLEPDSLPRLSVLLVDAHGGGQSEKLSLSAAGAARTPEQRVAAEVASEALFFRHAFGALPDRPLSAVEGSEESATSTPQLVRLPKIFARQPDQAEPAPFFRAREVARQWWGNEIRPASSHDAWLCEGLANFSAAWCMQNGAPGTEAYLGLLESWRRQLIQQRDALPGRSTPASALRMGARLDESPGAGTRTDAEDQSHLVHQATWVIHMLRGLMLDPEDPDERRFADLLHTLYVQYRGRAIRTEAFRAAAERAAGRDLGWFFDQWVDHGAIPTYTFSYRVDPGADGRYVVRGRVRQSHVPPSFRMDVPVRVDAEAGAPERLRVQVQGPVTEFELPAMPQKPVRVVFNDLGAVLCEVVPAPWE